MSADSKHTIILTGGGTGGHILPLRAVLEKLQKSKDNLDYYYFGSGNDLENKIFLDSGVHYKKIYCGKFRRNFGLISIFRNIFDLFLTIFGILQAYKAFGRIRPTVIFSKGGFVALPSVVAGWLRRIPIIAHESDILMGLSNRLTLNMVKRIGVAFPLNAYAPRVLRKAFYAGIPLDQRFEENFQKATDKGEYILIVGGSSGATSLNSTIFEILGDLLQKHSVYHLTGQRDFKRAEKIRDGLPKELRPKYTIAQFSSEMPKLISGAKLVISRCGATAIFEIAASHKKAVFIPISKSVASHQMVNALYLEMNKFAEIVSPEQSSKELLKKIEKLMSSEFNEEFSDLYFKDSAEIIAQAILDEIEIYKFKEVENIFLIGIGGVAMKGLAKILETMKKNVYGSDLKLGGHSKQNITSDLDMIVYSSAASANSEAKVEHDEAKKLNIPIFKRSEMIGRLMRGKMGVVVSGMHGKTTITTLIANILNLNEFAPSYLIGADDSRQSVSAQFGQGGMFVVEGCEYDRSFFDFKKDIAIISNIEEEHLDYFKGGLKEIVETFGVFIEQINPGGFLIYCADDDNVNSLVLKKSALLKAKHIKTISYGFTPAANIKISDYRTENGLVHFSLNSAASKITLISTLPGEHFARNVAASFALSQIFSLNPYVFEGLIAGFEGAKRRFEFVGEIRNIKVYDDYAHHPSEISATLKGLNELYKKSRKIIVFEPHQQSRFNALYNDFRESFKNVADAIIILPVFKVAGRDEEAKNSSVDLVDDLNSGKTVKAFYASDYESAEKILDEQVRVGDIVMTMGATNVYKIGLNFFKKKGRS